MQDSITDQLKARLLYSTVVKNIRTSCEDWLSCLSGSFLPVVATGSIALGALVALFAQSGNEPLFVE